MRRLTAAELTAIADRDTLAPSLDRSQLLGHLAAVNAELEELRTVAHAAREYLAHDGSGVDEPEGSAWRGDYDLAASWRARDDLRAALEAVST